jgi:F0F1-type ATP synthase assembly protein I
MVRALAPLATQVATNSLQIDHLRDEVENYREATRENERRLERKVDDLAAVVKEELDARRQEREEHKRRSSQVLAAVILASSAVLAAMITAAVALITAHP